MFFIGTPMKPILSLFVALILLAAPAKASFHLYDINEVFTNLDGSVQFIELFTTFTDQEFLLNHTIKLELSAVPNTVQKTFTFPSNGPSPTGTASPDHQFLLIGTANM